MSKQDLKTPVPDDVAMDREKWNTRASSPREEVKPVSGVEEIDRLVFIGMITYHMSREKFDGSKAWKEIADWIQHDFPHGIKIKAGGD